MRSIFWRGDLQIRVAQMRDETSRTYRRRISNTQQTAEFQELALHTKCSVACNSVAGRYDQLHVSTGVSDWRTW